MQKSRIRIVVEVDLDPTPGWGNDPLDHVTLIKHTMLTAWHYNPVVTFDGYVVEAPPLAEQMQEEIARTREHA